MDPEPPPSTCRDAAASDAPRVGAGAGLAHPKGSQSESQRIFTPRKLPPHSGSLPGALPPP